MCGSGLRFSNHRNLRSTRSPVPRPAPCMCDGDDLKVAAAYAIHDKERKAAKEYASRVTQIRRPGSGLLGDPSDRPFELALKATRCGLVLFAVPPFSSLR